MWFGRNKRPGTLSIDDFKKNESGQVVVKRNTVVDSINIEAARLDPGSQTWLFVKAWAEKRREDARDECSFPKNNIEKTSIYRGHVQILDELLDLPNDKKKGLLDGI